MDRHSRGGGVPRRRRLGVPACCYRRDCQGYRGLAGAHKPCRYGGPHLTGMASRRANSGRSRVGPQAMTDDPIPWTLAEPEAMVVVARKARRHRHSWGDLSPRFAEDARVRCIRCDVPKDPATSRRGKSARNRGNAFEREIAAALGVRRVGQYGSPTDVEGDWIAVQCKVGVAFPERLWGWLPPGRGGPHR